MESSRKPVEKRKQKKVGSSNGGGDALQKKEQRNTWCFRKLKRGVTLSARFKTGHACIVEAHESTRKRLESSLPKNHEDDIAEREGSIR